VPAGKTVLVDDLIRGEQRFESDQIGDFIIRRGDGTPAFFFCNAVDDALMGITHVLRGEDHMANTPRQLLLLEALSLPAPRYGHMPLIVGEDGAPLSKRHGSFALVDLRAAGYLPLAILNYLARLGHHYETDHLLEQAELITGFRLSAIGRAPARFEVAQLRHWQKLAVMGLSTPQFLDWLGEGLMQRIPEPAREAFVAIVRPNVVLPADAAHWVRIVYEDPAAVSPALEEVVKKAGAAFFTSAWQAYLDADCKPAPFLERLKQLTGVRGKALFEPLRLALTGEAHGPELRDLLQLIPPESVQARLHKCAELAAH
jgi:glutamyl-tRNA synthetase